MNNSIIISHCAMTVWGNQVINKLNGSVQSPLNTITDAPDYIYFVNRSLLNCIFTYAITLKTVQKLSVGRWTTNTLNKSRCSKSSRRRRKSVGLKEKSTPTEVCDLDSISIRTYEGGGRKYKYSKWAGIIMINKNQSHLDLLPKTFGFTKTHTYGGICKLLLRYNID